MYLLGVLNGFSHVLNDEIEIISIWNNTRSWKWIQAEVDSICINPLVSSIICLQFVYAAHWLVRRTTTRGRCTRCSRSTLN